MSETILKARAAAKAIQGRVCCYGTKFGDGRPCDCKFLSANRLGGMSSEQTGCAEARHILLFLEELERTRRYDADELELMRSYARRLQKACHYAMNPAAQDDANGSLAGDTVIGGNTLSMTMTSLTLGGSEFMDVVKRRKRQEDDDTAIPVLPRSARCTCSCEPMRSRGKGGRGCFEAHVIRDCLRAIPDEFKVKVKDAGVQTRVRLVLDLETVIRVDMESLAAHLVSTGNDAVVLDAIYRCLCGNNAADPLVLQFDGMLDFGEVRASVDAIELAAGCVRFDGVLAVLSEKVFNQAHPEQLAEWIIASTQGVECFTEALVIAGSQFAAKLSQLKFETPTASGNGSASTGDATDAGSGKDGSASGDSVQQ